MSTPASDAKRPAAEGIASPPLELEELLRQLPRSSLEAIVRAAVLSGSPVTRGALERHATSTRASIHDFGPELLELVLQHVEPRQRARATRVSKAWYGTKLAAALWEQLPFDECVSPEDVLRRLDWLPELGRHARGVSIHTRKETQASVPRAILRRPERIERLRLHGPKITAAVLGLLAPPRANHLVELDIKNIKDRSSGAMTALHSAVLQMSRLTCLRLPAFFLSSTFLQALAMTPQGGALRELHVRGGILEGADTSWALVTSLGACLPRLEMVRLTGIGDLPFQLSPGRAAAIAPLPQLRTLEIVAQTNYICGQVAQTHARHGFCGMHLHALLGAVFDAAPALETFMLCAPCDNISATVARKFHLSPMPLAPLSGAFVAHPPPRTLRDLFLSNVHIEPSDFEGVDLPQLHTLVLARNCTGKLQEAADVLRASCSALTSVQADAWDYSRCY